MISRLSLTVAVLFLSTLTGEAHRTHGRFGYGRLPVFSPMPYFNFRPMPYGFGWPKSTVAKVTLVSGGDSGVTGELVLEQRHPWAAVLIQGRIHGLKKGMHGFHVHTDGKLGNDCKDAAGHFNPFMKDHGDPNANFYASTSSLDSHPSASERHVGDLGNIMTFADTYPTDVVIFDKIITLEKDSKKSIVGRSIVVHAGQDDLGRGGNEESTKTGNAGSRVACGVIELVN